MIGIQKSGSSVFSIQEILARFMPAEDISLKKLNKIRKLSDEELEAALDKAVEAARHRKMGKKERESQIVSFVWGNAPEGNQGTLKTVRESLNRVASN